MAKSIPFSEQLRQAIVDSGMTRYRICQLTGIDNATLSRFHNGERGLPMDTIDKVCECIGAKLVLEVKRQATAKPKTKPKRKSR